MSKTKHSIIPAVYMLLKKGDSVLLLRRFNTGYKDGFYSLPAGHLNGGESLIQAAIREAKEEVGVDVSPSDMKLIHVMNRPHADDAERVDFFFETERWAGEPQVMEPDKCDEVRWVDLKEVEEMNLIPYIRLMFEKRARHEVYSDTELN